MAQQHDVAAAVSTAPAETTLAVDQAEQMIDGVAVIVLQRELKKLQEKWTKQAKFAKKSGQDVGDKPERLVYLERVVPPPVRKPHAERTGGKKGAGRPKSERKPKQRKPSERAAGGENKGKREKEEGAAQNKSQGAASDTPGVSGKQRPFPVVRIHPFFERMVQMVQDGRSSGDGLYLFFLVALQQAIRDMVQVKSVDIRKGFFQKLLGTHIRYVWEKSRADLPSMVHTFAAALKVKIDLTVMGAPETVQELILKEVEEELVRVGSVSHEPLIEYGSRCIHDDDTILTYGYSPLVAKILRHVWVERGASIRLVVLNSRPFDHGRRLLDELADLSDVRGGIPITFLDITSASFNMQSVTRVLVHGDTVLRDGSVKAPAGTAAVCMLANELRKPVHVVCTVRAFSSAIRVDSLGTNEEWKLQTGEDVRSLPLADLTPSQFITGFICEHGRLPTAFASVDFGGYAKGP